MLFYMQLLKSALTNSYLVFTRLVNGPWSNQFARKSDIRRQYHVAVSRHLLIYEKSSSVLAYGVHISQMKNGY